MSILHEAKAIKKKKSINNSSNTIHQIHLHSGVRKSLSPHGDYKVVATFSASIQKENFKLDPSLPYIKMICDITIGKKDLQNIFSDKLFNKGFKLKINEAETFVWGEKSNGSILESLCSCLFKKKSESMIIALNIIHSNINQYERVIELFGMKGSSHKLEQNMIRIVNSMIDYSKRHSKKLKIIKLNNVESYNLLKQVENIEDTNVIDISNKEASSYYEIYKILSNTKYQLGQSIKDFIINIKNDIDISLNDSKAIAMKLESIIKFIETSENSFQCYYNLGNKQINDLLVSKFALEKYIFNKLYPFIYSLYNNKFLDENEAFLRKLKNINNKLSLEDMVSYLGVSVIY